MKNIANMKLFISKEEPVIDEILFHEDGEL
jgi:hypothetical protein